ncbi:MAG: divalent-cation tolerance protein CutA [Dehalococcoidales bacterium]|nr:divalent-cation tolerance protein CutA [Dehalococcoidales bacterium]
MTEPAYAVIFITTATNEEAERISRRLLEKRLIACASIIPKIGSHFWWQDRINTVEESLLIAKTRIKRLEELVRQVKETHSYSTPEIIALPIIGGSREYLEWIGEEVTEGPE